VALAPMAPAPNQMSNIGVLSKMSQTVTVSYFSGPIQFRNNLNKKELEAGAVAAGAVRRS
jgi:hypothetical protein